MVFISCFIFMFIIQTHIGMDWFKTQMTIGANGVYAEMYQWYSILYFYSYLCIRIYPQQFEWIGLISGQTNCYWCFAFLCIQWILFILSFIFISLYSYLISDQMWSIKLLMVLCKETIGIHAFLCIHTFLCIRIWSQIRYGQSNCYWCYARKPLVFMLWDPFAVWAEQLQSMQYNLP